LPPPELKRGVPDLGFDGTEDEESDWACLVRLA
jgi:hypothetical protein